VKVTLPLTELLRTTEIVRTMKALGTGPGKRNIPLAKGEWTREAELAFRNLMKACTDAPILQYFVPAKPIILQTDANGFAIAGILDQYDAFGTLQPVNFYSRTSSAAEQNYDTYDWELLTFVEMMKQWQHYLMGANYSILIQRNHKNIMYFQTSKVLSRRQARCVEIVSS